MPGQWKQYHTAHTPCQTGTDRGSIGHNRSSTAIIRGLTGSYRARPYRHRCETGLHRGSTGPTTGSSVRPVYRGRDTVEPQNEPVSPRRRPSLPRFLTSFPVHPGCIKHFKITWDMSLFAKVLQGAGTAVIRFITVQPRTQFRDEPGSQTGTVRTQLNRHRLFKIAPSIYLSKLSTVPLLHVFKV